MNIYVHWESKNSFVIFALLQWAGTEPEISLGCVCWHRKCTFWEGRLIYVCFQLPSDEILGGRDFAIFIWYPITRHHACCFLELYRRKEGGKKGWEERNKEGGKGGREGGGTEGDFDQQEFREAVPGSGSKMHKCSRSV